jgi:hypothetical protein
VSRSFDGTNDALTYAAKLVDATTIETTPISFVVWFKRGRTAFGTTEMLMQAGPTNLTSHLIAIGINPTTDTLFCRTRTTSTADATDTTNPVSDTTNWHMALGVWDTPTSRTIVVDGNASVTDTVSRDPTTATDMFRLGATLESGFGAEFQGLMAYACVWNATLSPADAATLWNGGAGCDPRTVKPASVVGFWDLTGNESPEVNDQTPGTGDLTLNGTTFSTDNPFTLSALPNFLLPMTIPPMRTMLRL